MLSECVGPAEPKIQLPLVRDTNILKIQLLITTLSQQNLPSFNIFGIFLGMDLKQLLDGAWRASGYLSHTKFSQLFEFSICFKIWDREQDSIQDSIMVRPLI